MKTGQRIKLTKVEHINDEFYTKESVAEEQDGARYNGIPENHCVVGVLNKDIEVGKSLDMLREERNGVKVVGMYITTPIEKIGKTTIETRSSIYKYEIL